jgi:hypothetical protein
MSNMRRLDRHDDPRRQLEHAVEHLAVQAGRRVEDDMRGALGRPGDVVRADLPGVDGRQLEGADGQPFARRLLAVDVAEHDVAPLIGKVAGQVGGQRALAGAALGIGDEKGFHEWDFRLSRMWRTRLTCSRRV